MNPRWPSAVSASLRFPVLGSRLGAAALALVALALSARAGDISIAQLIGARAPTAILRIIPDETPPNQRLDSLVFLAGYQAVGDPVSLNPAQAARLAAMVQAPASFNDTEPEAKMRPGVAYRFGTGADAVHMLVCFSCDKVAVIPPGKDAVGLSAHLTQPARDVLLALAKELLPQDDAIQELPRIRSEHAVPPPPAPVPKDAPRPGQSS